MDRIDRIASRLPRFYKSWDKGSLLRALLESVGRELDLSELRMTEVMKTRWVDTAEGEELDRLGRLLSMARLPDEEDGRFRQRLKRGVEDYRGGGTVATISDAVRRLVNARSDEDVEIVENPPAPGSAEFTVGAGERWFLASNSIEDAQPSITLTVEEAGEVSKPEITNLDIAETVTFQGKLSGKQQLKLSSEGAMVDGRKVAKGSIRNDVPKLLRRGSVWRYSESLGRQVGVFDEAKFDEQTFAVAVPPVRILFEWERLQPATFEVRVDPKSVGQADLKHIQQVVDSLKAAGTTALVRVKER